MPAKSKLGQNFLRDPQAAERIVAALGDLTGATVVEIGPGRGALTGAIAGKAKHVLAVELDCDLAASLRRQFPPERVTVIEQDVLQFDFRAAAAKSGTQLRVAGNLPYYITSPILLRLAACHAALDIAVLMVQREVAARATAAPGSRDYGVLSVAVQAHGPAEPLFTLPPSAFSPPPEVHSTAFRWRFAPRFAELGVEQSSFLRLVRQAFAQKRKTLTNNLRAADGAGSRRCGHGLCGNRRNGQDRVALHRSAGDAVARTQFERGSFGSGIAYSVDCCLDHDLRQAYALFRISRYIESEERAMKSELVAAMALFASMAGMGQSPGPAQSKEVRGQGRVQAGVEAGCLVVKEAKSGRLYNLLIKGAKPAPGTGIEFTGVRFEGVTMCMQGAPLTISKWEKLADMKCAADHSSDK